MIERLFMIIPTALALVAVVVTCLVRKTGVRRMALYLVLTVYVGAVAAVTLFPLPIDRSIGAHMVQGGFIGSWCNIVPFAGIAQTLSEAAYTGWWFTIAVTILGGNIAMFVPLGVMLPLVSPKLQKLKAALPVFVACSVGIELSQLLIGLGIAGYPYRVVDIDDVILNTIGGLVGFALWRLFARLREPAAS